MFGSSRNPYDISNTSYTKSMAAKTAQYNGLITRAERVSLQKGPCEELAELYAQATVVINEIMQLNLSQPAVLTQWTERKQTAEKKHREVLEVIAPELVEPDENDNRVLKEKETVGSRKPRAGKNAKTSSGFTTRNAIPGSVEAEMIESWFPKDESLDHDFDDVKGMDDLKHLLMREAGTLDWKRIDEALGISPVQSYFFYGPPGSGKTYLIEAFVKELKKKGFNYMKLDGGNIHQGLVGVAEKIVSVAFKEAVDKAPCILFIDEVDNVCIGRTGDKVESHERATTVAFLQAFNELRKSKEHVVFIGATNHPARVDSAMLDRVRMVRVPLPTVEAREQVFAHKLKAITLEPGFTFRDMAECTDNYSQRDLFNLYEAIKLQTRDEAVDTYRVENDQGELDKEKTDIRGSEAILEKRMTLSKEAFMKLLNDPTLRPVDKSQDREELQRFEKQRGLNV